MKGLWSSLVGSELRGFVARVRIPAIPLDSHAHAEQSSAVPSHLCATGIPAIPFQKNNMKYKKALKSSLWGIAGFIVSISIINKDKSSLFGYPLFVLSFLMFILSMWQLFETNQKHKWHFRIF